MVLVDELWYCKYRSTKVPCSTISAMSLDRMVLVDGLRYRKYRSTMFDTFSYEFGPHGTGRRTVVLRVQKSTMFDNYFSYDYGKVFKIVRTYN